MAATRHPRVRLLHIRDEIDGVTAATSGVSFAQYKTSYPCEEPRSAQYKSFPRRPRCCRPIILHATPTRRGAIIGIGNILRHEYQEINDRRLWDIVTVHLLQ
jgi:uncharacterized protein with HEPN domain